MQESLFWELRSINCPGTRSLQKVLQHVVVLMQLGLLGWVTLDSEARIYDPFACTVLFGDEGVVDIVYTVEKATQQDAVYERSCVRH